MRWRAFLWIPMLALALGLLTGCGLLSKEPASIASITLTDRVDERTKEAVGAPKASFPAGTARFYAVAKVLNPKKGTKVRAVWYFENRVVDEAEVSFDITGDRHVAFNLVSQANKTFPSGPYKVELYLDGQKVQEKSFKVE